MMNCPHCGKGIVLTAALSPDAPKGISAERIVEQVAEYYELHPHLLYARTKQMEFVKPRWVAYWLIRKYAGLSLKSIGRLFKQHHTTVLNGLSELNGKLSNSRRLQQDLD